MVCKTTFPHEFYYTQKLNPLHIVNDSTVIIFYSANWKFGDQQEVEKINEKDKLDDLDIIYSFYNVHLLFDILDSIIL